MVHGIYIYIYIYIYISYGRAHSTWSRIRDTARNTHLTAEQPKQERDFLHAPAHLCVIWGGFG